MNNLVSARPTAARAYAVGRKIMSYCWLHVLVVASAAAAEPFTVAATRADAGDARPGEVIVVPYAEVQRRLPDARMFHFVVTNAQTGTLVRSQLTNYEHDHRGFAPDELIFQHDFAAGEATARFTVEQVATLTAPEPTRVFARYIPERYDDFAWENDRIAHRMYGPGLDSPAAGRERLRGSGIDIWVKRVRYPIVDRWYLKGHDGLHIDDGEGLDPYSIGGSRGAGGTGIWDGRQLYTSGNYATWKVLANGPLRAVFELGYAPWATADGLMVSETKRFVVDAGRNFHAVESTFTFTGAAELTVGIGISKSASSSAVIERQESARLMTSWQETKSGGLGIGVMLAPGASFAGFAEEPPAKAGAPGNVLLLAKVRSGEPLRYYIGAGWDQSGDFKDRAAWQQYAAGFARRVGAPVQVKLP